MLFRSWLKNLIVQCEEALSEVDSIDAELGSAEFEIYGNRIEVTEIALEGKEDACFSIENIVKKLKEVYQAEIQSKVAECADDESIVV